MSKRKKPQNASEPKILDLYTFSIIIIAFVLLYQIYSFSGAAFDQYLKPALNWTCSQIGNSNSACDRIQSLEPFYATQYYAYDDQQFDQQYNQGYYTEDNDDYTEENSHYQLRQNIF